MAQAVSKTMYDSYKTDTALYLTFIVNTAKNLGHTPYMTRDGPQLSRRLKGKQRKEAKASAINEISTKEIILCSEFIRMKKEKADIPAWVVKCAINAIRIRMKCNDWFSRINFENNEENRSHSHFIEILKKSLEILKPCIEPQPSKSQPATADSPAELTTENLFARLAMEDLPSDDEMPVRVEANNKKDKNQPTIRAAEDEVDEELELCLSICCLFQEMHRIRQMLFLVWKQYRDKETDIFTATILTSVAIEVAGQLEADFYRTQSTCKNHNEIIELLKRRMTEGNEDELYSLTYHRAYHLLALHHDGYKMPDVTLVQGQPMYDMMARERNPNPGRVIDMFPDGVDSLHRVIDHTRRGLVHFKYRSKDRFAKDRAMPPTCLALALQVVFDIATIFPEGNMRAIEDCRRVLYYQQHCFGDSEEAREIAESDVPTAPIVTTHRMFKGRLEHLDNQVLAEPCGREISASEMISKNMITTGMQCFEAIAFCRQVGLMCMRLPSEISSCSFMYNLMQQLRPSAPRWEAMEDFYQLQGDSKLFMGSRPQTLRDSVKRITAHAGTSMQIKRKWRSGAPIGRPLGETSRFMEILWTDDAYALAETSLLAELEQLFKAEWTKEIRRSRGPVPTSYTNPAKFLTAVLGKLRADSTAITFNYYSLHAQCREQLEYLMTAFAWTLDDMFDLSVGASPRVKKYLLGLAILGSANKEEVEHDTAVLIAKKLRKPRPVFEEPWLEEVFDMICHFLLDHNTDKTALLDLFNDGSEEAYEPDQPAEPQKKSVCRDCGAEYVEAT